VRRPELCLALVECSEVFHSAAKRAGGKGGDLAAMTRMEWRALACIEAAEQLAIRTQPVCQVPSTGDKTRSGAVQ
jgi:hypothetical protein